MFVARVSLLASLTLALQYAQAWPSDRDKPPGSIDCTELNQLVVNEVARGQIAEAEARLSSALASGASDSQPACAGLILNNLAAIMLNSARLAEAEAFAHRALHSLEAEHPPNDPVLLRPFQILAAARLREGKIGSARQAFERMRSIQAVRPEERALVDGMAAALLAAERRYGDAETEYLKAIADLEEAERLNTADGAALVQGLASAYLGERRFEEAGRALARALAILAQAQDAVAVDLINVLSLRAVLHTRLHQWRDAEADLLSAIPLASPKHQMDPSVIRSLYRNYAMVLRKMHRKREAQSMEAKAAALDVPSAGLVDVTELVARSADRDNSRHKK